VRRDFPNDAETKFREIKFHAKENLCKNFWEFENFKKIEKVKILKKNFLSFLKFPKKSLRNVKNFIKNFWRNFHAGIFHRKKPKIKIAILTFFCKYGAFKWFLHFQIFTGKNNFKKNF
jgi:hypothetical protein